MKNKMRERAPLKILVGILEKEYRIRYRVKYQDSSAMKLSGRQRTRVKELLEIFSVSEICVRVRNYFADPSDWLQQRRHPWNVFVAGIDQYGGKHGKGKGKGDDWIKKDLEEYQRRKGG